MLPSKWTGAGYAQSLGSVQRRTNAVTRRWGTTFRLWSWLPVPGFAPVLFEERAVADQAGPEMREDARVPELA